MPNSARVNDIWTGICCCHPPIPCIGMAGPIIQGSPNIKSGNLAQGRITDMVIGYCGHVGFIISGSPNCKSNNLASARVGDSVSGCTIGVIVTGSPTHTIN